jgi:uncharacterized protein (TIGR02569 family)
MTMAGVLHEPPKSASPGDAILAAFGLSGEVTALTGGEGRSVRVGDVVLKPVDDEEEATWCAEVLSGIEQAGFRVPDPLRTVDGSFVVDGWSAASWVAGEPGVAGHWTELLDASRSLHGALRRVSRPTFLDRRTHRWAIGDRVAWGEERTDVPPLLRRPLERLLATLRPVKVDRQAVHGDLYSNVLFAPGEPPAIIDLSPYWRPVAYAEAIAVADGLLWYGDRREGLELVAEDDSFPQMLARAVIFRLVSGGLLHRTDEGFAAEVRSFEPAIDLVERSVLAG